ncbi:MAG: energy-coupling factor transporter transmembrane protein EcfT [Clostridia bacterium]|nr:energy-coupling factor transporter transmembrane protein EcfT [Clostridia bacterium]
MMRDITLGQYYNTDSVIHSLDPRTKLTLTFGYLILIFLISKMWLFAFAAAFIAVVTILSKVPFSMVLRSLKPMRWLLLFMFVLNLFMSRSGEVLFKWWIFELTTGGIRQALFMTFRLLLLVMGTSLMTFTTTPIALTDGLEKLLAPLKKIGFPAHELAMMMTIALRFIPILLEESDKITKAQLSRGADLESGNIIKKAKSMVPILVPLFISAFRRADELAMAMESRCYHGDEGRTRMRVLTLKKCDFTAFLVFALVFVSVLLLQNLMAF